MIPPWKWNWRWAAVHAKKSNRICFSSALLNMQFDHREVEIAVEDARDRGEPTVRTDYLRERHEVRHTFSTSYNIPGLGYFGQPAYDLGTRYANPDLTHVNCGWCWLRLGLEFARWAMLRLSATAFAAIAACYYLSNMD